MATMNLNWTPAPASNPNYTNQRAKAIAKPNGLNPDRLLGFTPQNLMGKTVSSATYTTDYVNIIYRFMVETICSNTTLPNTNGVQEQIVFRCLQPLPKSQEIIDNTTYTMQLLRNGYNQLDFGQVFPNPVLSIDSVEVSLADSNGIVKGPFTATQTTTGPSNTEIYQHIFTGLTPGTTYTPRSVLLATILINGVATPVRSDSAQYLGAICLHPTVTTTGTTTCSIYQITNQGATNVNYTYTACGDIVQTTSTLIAGGSSSVCAENGSVSATGNTIITQGASCSSITPSCNNWQNQTVDVITGDYTDCNGVIRTITISPNSTVCARVGPPGTTITGPCGNGNWSVTNNRTTSEFQNFDFTINNTFIASGSTTNNPPNVITGTSSLIPVNGANVQFTISNTQINAVELNGVAPFTSSGPAGVGAPVTYGWTNVTANQLDFVIVGN